MHQEDAKTVSKKFSCLTVALLAYTALCAVVAYNKAYTLPVALVKGSVMQVSSVQRTDFCLVPLCSLASSEVVALLPCGLFLLACRGRDAESTTGNAVPPSRRTSAGVFGGLLYPV